MSDASPPRTGALGVVLAAVRPFRGALLLATGLLLLESAAMLAAPWFAGRLAGGFLDAGAEGPPAGLLLAGLIGVLGVQSAMRAAGGWVGGAVSARLLAALRVRIHDHLLRLPMGFHESRRQGDLMALVTHEAVRLSDFVSDTLIRLPPMLATAAGAVVLMVLIDPMLGLLVPAVVPVFHVMLRLMARPLRTLARRLQEAEAAAVAALEEHLSMLAAIKAFAREARDAGRHRAVVEAGADLAVTEARIFAVLDPLAQFVAAAAAVGLLWFAGSAVRSGGTSPAEMVSLLLYAALLTRPLGALAGVYGRFQTARGALSRLQAVLAEPEEPGYGRGLAEGPRRGAVAFDGVGFAYPGRPPVLRGADLRIEPGETVALLGDNGAGKSTLIALMQRLHDPDAGTVRIDGRDVRDYEIGALRRAIGLVPQRPLLVNGTVAENIGYGREAPSAERIEAAARLAQAHDFVAALPDGYATEIGDHGVRLSGGQRQRLALARALLVDPPILVLDEATSMFDLEGERAFVEACAEAFRDRTVILITHRPASLALADRRVTLRDGRLEALAAA